MTERDGTSQETVTFGDTKLTLSTLTEDDVKFLQQRIKDERRTPLAMVAPLLETMSPEAQEVMLRVAFDKEPQFEDYITEDQGDQFRSTKKGQALVIWLMARGNHPDLTEEHVLELYIAEEEATLQKQIEEDRREREAAGLKDLEEEPSGESDDGRTVPSSSEPAPD